MLGRCEDVKCWRVLDLFRFAHFNDRAVTGVRVVGARKVNLVMLGVMLCVNPLMFSLIASA